MLRKDGWCGVAVMKEGRGLLATVSMMMIGVVIVGRAVGVMDGC